MSSPIELPEGALAWLHEHLPSRLQRSEGVRETARSTVLRLKTDEGDCYFKADHILPPPEATILARLAESRPEQVAPLVAVDEARGWSVTRDAGSTSPTCLDDATTEEWCSVARAFAELQRSTGLTADEWKDLGCRDHRGPKLFVAFVEMIETASPLLNTSEQEALQRLLPTVEESCSDLASDGLASTLVHQDLVPENLIWRDGRAVFLDWSDTVVGHPFFGLDRLLDFCWSDAERKSAVIHAYLEGFAGEASAERLQASFQRVLSLRVLYEDLRWHHEIQALPQESEHAARLRADQLAGLRMVAERVP